MLADRLLNKVDFNVEQDTVRLQRLGIEFVPGGRLSLNVYFLPGNVGKIKATIWRCCYARSLSDAERCGRLTTCQLDCM